MSESIDVLRAELPLAVRNAATLFNSSRRQKEWLATRQLLRQMYPHALHIEHDELGKPTLIVSENDNLSSQCISISHSRKMVAVLLHPTIELGVDIEQIDARAERIKHKFLSEEEFRRLPFDTDYSYCLYWSAKESLYKWYAKKALDFRENIHLRELTIQEGSHSDADTAHMPFVKQSGQLIASIQKGDEYFDLSVQFAVLSDHVLTWIVQ